jgi:hypothetical protein
VSSIVVYRSMTNGEPAGAAATRDVISSFVTTPFAPSVAM